MTPSTQCVSDPASRKATEAQQLGRLLRQAESGDFPPFENVLPLTNARDRTTRGLAKRLLATLIEERSLTDVARLLAEACRDLDYTQPQIFDEARARLFQRQDTEPLFELQMTAAETALRRGDLDAALVETQNALTVDYHLGGKSGSDLQRLRRVIRVYERTAQQAAQRAQIVPAPRGQRRSPTDGKLRLAHCVCQLIDNGHGPTRLVRSMARYADRERFDNYIVVTDAFTQRPGQPHQIITSPDSTVRGPKIMQWIEQEQGIPILLPRQTDSFITIAKDLHAQLAEQQIDVVFYHGSTSCPTDWLLCAWQAGCWQLDRGFGQPLFCPNLHYQFFELAPAMERLNVLCAERSVPYGLSPNSSVDYREVIEAEPFPRADYGIPDDHVVLGTVGNHLAERMGREFCEVVAETLRKYPRTTFLIVGEGNFQLQPTVFGPDLVGDQGPGSRVQFVGRSNEPARFTQMFDIYLNEFPGGGGLSVCDAMACGKPVVCMLPNETSVSQAGAIYVGDENVVRPPTPEAYRDRLHELIENADKRQALGEKMRTRHRTTRDPQKFIDGMMNKTWEVVGKDLGWSD